MGMKAERAKERHGRSLVNDHLGALRSCIAERVFAAEMAAGNLGYLEKNANYLTLFSHGFRREIRKWGEATPYSKTQ